MTIWRVIVSFCICRDLPERATQVQAAFWSSGASPTSSALNFVQDQSSYPIPTFVQNTTASRALCLAVPLCQPDTRQEITKNLDCFI
jgi:hypothetical protein